MTISELIEKIGNKNIKFHWMHDVVTSMNWNAKTGLTTMIVKTDQQVTPDGFRDIGLLIWLPRKEAEMLLTNARNDSQESES